MSLAITLVQLWFVHANLHVRFTLAKECVLKGSVVVCDYISGGSYLFFRWHDSSPDFQGSCLFLHSAFCQKPGAYIEIKLNI